MIQFIKLFFLGIWVALKDLVQLFRVIWRYYRHPRFMVADILCLVQYLLCNPYTLCREALMRYPSKEVQCYGETPLTTFASICDALELKAHDVFYELGCGRGRTLFWIQSFTPCRAVGIDLVPAFITRGQCVVRWLGLDRIQFCQENIINVDYSEATVIYLFGTSLEDEFITRLCEIFKQLSPGTRIITTSYSLLPYLQKNTTDSGSADAPSPLVVEHQLEGRFVWGVTDIYIHRKT